MTWIYHLTLALNIAQSGNEIILPRYPLSYTRDKKYMRLQIMEPDPTGIQTIIPPGYKSSVWSFWTWHLIWHL